MKISQPHTRKSQPLTKKSQLKYVSRYHPPSFFLYLFGFQKIIINFRGGGGGFQHLTPLKISQPPPPPPPLKISQTLPKKKVSPRENMVTGTTTSFPIHFSSSLYLFFTFPKKNSGGGRSS